MARYSPADVLQAKRDVTKARGEFLAVRKEIDEALALAENLKKEIHTLRSEKASLMQNVEESYIDVIARAKSEYQRLVDAKYSLLNDIQRLNSIVGVLQQKIHVAREPSAVPLLESVERELGSVISAMQMRYDSLGKDVSIIAGEHEQLTKESRAAAQEHEKISKQLEETKKEYERKTVELNKTISNLRNVYGALEELERREKEVSIKEKRIDPEYQRIYFSQRKHTRVNTKKK